MKNQPLNNWIRLYVGIDSFKELRAASENMIQAHPMIIYNSAILDGVSKKLVLFC
jgi:hypothetical protein